MLNGIPPTTNEDNENFEWNSSLLNMLFSSSIPSPSELFSFQETLPLTDELTKNQEPFDSNTNSEAIKTNSSHKRKRSLDKESTEKKIEGKRVPKLDDSILLAPSANLTSEQKKQRRLIKNRDAAQRSRDRHKKYVFNLESTITDLEEENKQLKESNQALLREITMLKEQLAARETMAVSITTASRQILVSYDEQLQRDGLRRSTSSVMVIPTPKISKKPNTFF